jgi:hypothetical protein
MPVMATGIVLWYCRRLEQRAPKRISGDDRSRLTALVHPEM